MANIAAPSCTTFQKPRFLMIPLGGGKNIKKKGKQEANVVVLFRGASGWPATLASPGELRLPVACATRLGKLGHGEWERNGPWAIHLPRHFLDVSVRN